MLIRINRRKKFQLGCNLVLAFCKTHSTELQVSVHGVVIQMFCSHVSTVVISTNSSHLDVVIDHETLQPQRRGCDMSDTSRTSSDAMAHPAVASSLLSRLGLSTPSPNPSRFDFDSLLLQNYSKDRASLKRNQFPQLLP